MARSAGCFLLYEAIELFFRCGRFWVLYDVSGVGLLIIINCLFSLSRSLSLF